MDLSNIKLDLTDCRKCRVMPVLAEAQGDYPGHVRLECPECGFALESAPDKIAARWNSMHAEKEKRHDVRAGTQKWDVADYRVDPHALSDELDYTSASMSSDIFADL